MQIAERSALRDERSSETGETRKRREEVGLKSALR
jgi:hypothetical protein